MQMWPRHISRKTCCSLSNITSNHFPGKILRTPTWPLPLRPFLPTSSLILCPADGCNCQTVLWWTTLTCGGSELGGRERTAAEAESSVGPLILWGTGGSLLIIACWSQCSYSMISLKRSYLPAKRCLSSSTSLSLPGCPHSSSHHHCWIQQEDVSSLHDNMYNTIVLFTATLYDFLQFCCKQTRVNGCMLHVCKFRYRGSSFKVRWHKSEITK